MAIAISCEQKFNRNPTRALTHKILLVIFHLLEFYVAIKIQAYCVKNGRHLGYVRYYIFSCLKKVELFWR